MDLFYINLKINTYLSAIHSCYRDIYNPGNWRISLDKCNVYSEFVVPYNKFFCPVQWIDQPKKSPVFTFM